MLQLHLWLLFTGTRTPLTTVLLSQTWWWLVVVTATEVGDRILGVKAKNILTFLFTSTIATQTIENTTSIVVALVTR